MTLYERIIKLIENSEDLSDLPNIAKEVQDLEKALQEREDKIAKLYETNRKYLAMIPMEEPSVEKEKEEEPPSIEEAIEAIKKSL